MIRLTLIILAFGFVLATEDGKSQILSKTTPGNGTWSKLTVQGREVDVFQPACAHSGSPLILSLHAWGTTKELQETTNDKFSHDAYIGPECAVIAYPEGKLRVTKAPIGGFTWNAGGCCPRDNVEHVDDVKFLGEVITQVTRTLSAVSEDLVFVVGISNGGMMANRLACFDGRIKAMVAIAGPLVNGTEDHDLDTFTCSRRVPLLHFHGDADPIVPYNGCNTTSGSPLCRELMKIFAKSVADVLKPVPDYIRAWRIRNGQQLEQPGTVTFQNGTTNCTSWGDTASNVTLCVVGGQGHAWPGHCSVLNKVVPGCRCSQSIDASLHALAFLRQFIPSRTIVV